jgi:hypothetical protein
MDGVHIDAPVQAGDGGFALGQQALGGADRLLPPICKCSGVRRGSEAQGEMAERGVNKHRQEQRPDELRENKSSDAPALTLLHEECRGVLVCFALLAGGGGLVQRMKQHVVERVVPGMARAVRGLRGVG